MTEYLWVMPVVLQQNITNVYLSKCVHSASLTVDSILRSFIDFVCGV